MNSSPRRVASPFRVLSFGTAAVALGAACAVACSSSTSTPAAPISGDDDASSTSGTDAASGTGTGTIGSSEPDSGAGTGDDGAASDDGSSTTTGCPDIEGAYSLSTGGSGQAAECPSGETDVCTFTTDTSTCKLVGQCASSGMMFNASIDSTGKISYTESVDAGSFGAVSGNCTLQFSSDKTTITASCTFESIITCGGSGTYLGDGGVILDASTD